MARNVDSGIDPAICFSRRAISAPPSRPASWILIPLAPPSMVCSIARFIVRRKLARLESCSATSSATSWATTSGRLTSSILMLIRRPVQGLELVLKLLDPLPFAPDQHARTRRMQNHLDLVACPLDLDLGNRRIHRLAAAILALLDELADPLILDQQVGELLLGGVPPALPAGHDAGAISGRIDFLAHAFLSCSLWRSKERVGICKQVR